MATEYEWGKQTGHLNRAWLRCGMWDSCRDGLQAAALRWYHKPLGTIIPTMTHQAYQPLLPAGNKYLQQKWDRAAYDLHRHNVKIAKPTINITSPETYDHLALKLKKQKTDQDRNIKIQRENKLLSEKIAHIIHTTGVVDNLNYYEKKSLNMQQRQTELLRISHENQLMLQRLYQCKSHYSVKSWHQDWIKTMSLMDSIAQYPRRRTNTIKGQEKHHRDLGKVKIHGEVDKSSDTKNKKELEDEENWNETNINKGTKKNPAQNVTELGSPSEQEEQEE